MPRFRDSASRRLHRTRRTITRVMSSWRKRTEIRLSPPAFRTNASIGTITHRGELATIDVARNFAQSRALRVTGEIGPKKFAEPVALSSALPTDFRLPPTAARLGFDLLALRARRKRDSRGVNASDQDMSKRRARNLQKVQFSTFSTPGTAFCGEAWGNVLEPLVDSASPG